MGCKLICALTAAAVALQVIGAIRPICPSEPNCVCEGTLAIELNCNIDDRRVRINLLPNTYININCQGATNLDYNKLPKCANRNNSFKSVSFKDCPLPSTSFRDVLTKLGVSKTMALIFQNAKNLSGYFDRKHFAGLQDLTKLLLSVSGVTHLPDNLFADINKLTWLNIRANSINFSEELFKPLEKLETLEISHNYMTNISSNLFSHLSFLRKLSLWQSNVTWFSKDFFNGVDVLEELDLSSNGLNELPASIFRPLRKLKKLTLFSNKFSSLPLNLFTSNDELETVVILNNDVKMKELPKHLFGSLPNLKQVYIQRSGLESIPYEVFANSPFITNISLAHNDIETLPEAIFNDQINLLELDLSYNKLTKLEYKIFSSLVRLEKLDLGHNLLKEISGSTFSSLLSLILLNMENNNLQTIPSYLFSNNKQRMSISLAYNKLNFEHKQIENNSWIINQISPFAHTYNLRSLNLSHNAFKTTFDDWWTNGYDILDISYNHIHHLPTENDFRQLVNKRDARGFQRKLLKEVWISHNPLKCECKNYEFFNYLREHTKIKVHDMRSLECSIWIKHSCNEKYKVFISLGIMFSAMIVTTVCFCVVYRGNVYLILKSLIFDLTQINSDSDDDKNDFHDRIFYVKCVKEDSEFVFREMLPVLRDDNRILRVDFISKTKHQQSLNTELKNRAYPAYMTLVVFSPNYLTSVYSDVSIEKIKGEMSKASRTVYIFVDIGPDNSIYAFLKEQRDQHTTLLWGERNFGTTFSGLLFDDCLRENNGAVIGYEIDSKRNNKSKVTKGVRFSPSTMLSKPNDHPNLCAVDEFAYSQV